MRIASFQSFLPNPAASRDGPPRRSIVGYDSIAINQAHPAARRGKADPGGARVRTPASHPYFKAN